MQFISKLRDPIRAGRITCSVRIWQRPHVRVGGRYALPPGEIEITPAMELVSSKLSPVRMTIFPPFDTSVGDHLIAPAIL